MPKVSHHKFKFEDELHFVDIGYNKKDKFHCKLPQKMILALMIATGGNSAITSGFDTEAKLVEHITRLINEYTELTKTSRKVIIYSINGPTKYCMNSTGTEGHFSGTKPGMNGIAHDLHEDFGFGVSWDIRTEITENGEKKYFNESGYQERILDINTAGTSRFGTKHLIEWTPARQAFFERMDAQTEAIFTQIVRFLMSPDLPQLIESHGANLLLASNTKTDT